MRFRVSSLSLADGQAVHLLGSVPQLGAWMSDMSVPMRETCPHCWEAEVALPLSALGGEGVLYHYALRRQGIDNMVHEIGVPRAITMDDVKNTGA